MADRITYGGDGVLDEIVVRDAKVVHLERLSGNAINVSITNAQGKVMQFAILGGRKLHVTPFLED